MNEVILMAGAVFLGNLLTSLFLYNMFRISQLEKEGKRLTLHHCWGAAFPVIFAGGAVYLAMG